MKNLVFSTLLLFVVAACGQPETSTTSASPKKCDITKLPGQAFSGSGLSIRFQKNNKASYRFGKSDIVHLVDYSAETSCFVTLTDANVAGLKNGRKFLLRNDHSKLFDWNNDKVVLDRVNKSPSFQDKAATSLKDQLSAVSCVEAVEDEFTTSIDGSPGHKTGRLLVTTKESLDADLCADQITLEVPKAVIVDEIKFDLFSILLVRAK